MILMICLGYSMQMKAMASSNQHEAKRLYRLSLDKFKLVCFIGIRVIDLCFNQ